MINFKNSTLVSLILLLGCAAPPSKELIAETKNQKKIWFDSSYKWGQQSCENKASCDRMFRIAEDMINSYSDMKIQVATTTTIQTYTTNKLGYVSMSAKRTLKSGDSETISFNAICTGMFMEDYGNSFLRDSIDCYKRLTKIYEEYGSRIKAE